MMYWNATKGEFETAAEHFGYSFEHALENQIGGDEAIDAWIEEQSAWDGFGLERFMSENVELDYEDGNYYINPDVDLDKYAQEEQEEAETTTTSTNNNNKKAKQEMAFEGVQNAELTLSIPGLRPYADAAILDHGEPGQGRREYAEAARRLIREDEAEGRETQGTRMLADAVEDEEAEYRRKGGIYAAIQLAHAWLDMAEEAGLDAHAYMLIDGEWLTRGERDFLENTGIDVTWTWNVNVDDYDGLDWGDEDSDDAIAAALEAYAQTKTDAMAMLDFAARHDVDADFPGGAADAWARMERVMGLLGLDRGEAICEAVDEAVREGDDPAAAVERIDATLPPRLRGEAYKAWEAAVYDTDYDPDWDQHYL